MAKTKAQKQESVAALSDVAKKANSVVFASFDKLTVGDETELRRALRGTGNSYQVVKKTLLKRALNDAGFEGEMPPLAGMLAIAYGEDLISPAREVYNFQTAHKDNISIVGGVFDGKFMNQEEMMSIATIPSIKVLYGQIANVINSPIQGLVIALNALAEKKTA